MHHDTSLISLIVLGLGLAFVFGTVASRLRLSPLVGYLFAGMVIGPFTPGYVADASLAGQLAELGVILLMFGVGLHFSFKDLLAVKGIAIPGAVAQMAIATLLGMLLATAMGWGLGAGLVFGLALSVASTVVLLRALQEHNLIETEQGRIAVGWLVVEDLAMVLALVLLPAFSEALGGKSLGLANAGSVSEALAETLLKLAAFAGVLLVVGRRIIPKILHYVARNGSRELFRLAVLAIALGVAFGAAKLFGVSFALGAFFAGVILAESPLSHQAAEETLPLRDAFAVLFFVSVGMLFNPSVLLENPLLVLATVLVIVVGKSLVAYAIMRTSGYAHGTSLTISVSLAQIGEFSFILAGLGLALGLLPEQGQDVILAGAMLSIMLNPFLFAALERVKSLADLFTPQNTLEPVSAAVAAHKAEKLRGHAVLVGFDALGQMVGRNLLARGLPFYVLDERRQNLDEIEQHMRGGLHEHLVEYGPLGRANLKEAQWLITTISSADKVKDVVARARAVNPDIRVVVCTCSAVTPKDVGKVPGPAQPVFTPGDTGAPARIVDMLLDDGFVRAREA